jgi:hypothetical protein
MLPRVPLKAKRANESDKRNCGRARAGVGRRGMSDPAPEAVVKIKAILAPWANVYGQLCRGTVHLLVTPLALALTELSQEIERATWERAFSALCLRCWAHKPVSRQQGTWKHEGLLSLCLAHTLRETASAVNPSNVGRADSDASARPPQGEASQ